MDQAELAQLGVLLHSHSWQDSHDWARALGQLAGLSDSEMDTVLRAATETPGEEAVPALA
ncbi:hypothetical protein [Defluviicoccus vanus]|uniref:Uncharacterized protein n=1 Tax=Defluviicoccus vanus TaxID=111831 RepID=A0A7H1N137_9PROT|nr:hypothetical protein [Defluviicoccus vanus]QNT69423.1 hypothetical protein HQ394_08930 [Defluviicoccus vanus]